MSAAAPPLRSRRGLRRYLPLVLGLALLSVTIGVEPGAARSADPARPAAASASAEPGQETRASAVDQDIRPVPAVAAQPAPVVPDEQPAVPATDAALASGDAPVPGDPRAPPLPLA
jgi:cell division septation protein DedD